MKKNILGILVILFTLNINQSFSQEAEKDSIIPVSLMEVVVSTPFKESLKNNVTRVEKLSLSKINLTNSPVISFDKIRGVSSMSTGQGVLKPVIRGLYGSRVVTFTNNIRLENNQWGDDHGIEVNPFGTQSLEVIKGPMSVLYGSDAIGGVIYISPDSFVDGSPQFEFGSLYNSNYSGFTNNLGIKGSVGDISYIFQGSYVDNGNFSSPEEEIENTFFENTDFKAALGYSSSKFISELRLNYYETTIGIPHSEEEHDDHDDHGDDDHDDDHDDNHDDDDHDDEHEEEEESYQALENTTLSWKNTFIFNDTSELELTIGHTMNNRKEYGDHGHEDHDDHGDDDHGDDDHDDDDHDDDDHEDHDEEHSGAAMDLDLNTTSVDLKYMFAKTEKTEFIIGTSILSQENINHGEEVLVPDAKKNDFGLFGLAHFHGKVWDIMLGLRSDFRRIQKTRFDETYGSFTSSFGLKTDLSNGILRINYSSGYRAPNLSELFADGLHHGTARYYVGDQNLTEEKSNQIDFSISTFSSRSEFGFDLFANSLKDYIYLNPTGEEIDEMPVYNYIQDDANIFGGEFYYKRQSSLDWLSYETSVELLRGEKSNSDVLPFISPLSLKQSFNLEFNKSSFQLEAVFKGKKENVAQFETKTDSYFLLNLSGTYDVDFLSNDLKIGWSINNLTDKLYFDHMSRLKTMGIHEMGRNISVGINYQF
jgi:iron complex outermembrane receptor protein